MYKDCYFYLENTGESDEEQYIRSCCVDCAKQHHGKEKMWFWEGSKNGYGPYVFKCHKCNKVIYNPNDKDKITN